MTHFLQNPIIKNEALLTTIPAIIVVNQVKLQDVVSLLVMLFLVDLFTGIIASYFDWKKTVNKGKFFFGDKGGFSSDKFKKTFIKGIVYGGFPLIVWKFQQVFLFKNLHFTSLTDLTIDITTVSLLVFCANEIFSIFWENLPKCGLNIPRKIKNLVFGVKEIISTEDEVE